MTEGVVQGAVDGSTWKGELVAVPFWANTQLLWYRKSVADAVGLDPENEPVTWDQIIDAARAQDKDLAVQGVRAEALTVWINALITSAGGEIIEVPEAAAEVIGTIGRDGLGGPAAGGVVGEGRVRRDRAQRSVDGAVALRVKAVFGGVNVTRKPRQHR